jgi:hypothetical protein
MDFGCVGEFTEPLKEIRTLKVQTTIFEIRQSFLVTIKKPACLP